MKRIIYIKMILMMFIISTVCFAKINSDEKTKSFNVSKGGRLIVDVQSGDIKILTWEKNEIEMKVEGLDDEAYKYVDANLKGNELTVKYENDEDGSDSDVVFTFFIPSKFNLDLKTMGGDVDLKNNIEGLLDIDTYGGEIFTKNVNGSVKVETKGGDIILGEINGECKANTYGGDISIELINGKNAKVSTSGGDIKIKKSISGVSAKTFGGDIEIGNIGGDSELTSYGGEISTGFVNGNISMETLGGNLKVQGAKGKVKGKTNGGEIVVKKVEGSVDLKTLAGEVYVELNPTTNSESTISTNSGSIELILPASVKTTVEARIHIQGKWKDSLDDYKIKSDFNSGSYKNDNNKHDVVGTYNINGGGSKINLRTINDEIRIKKNLK